MRQILHVDMDAFFASVEQRDNPALRHRPVLVGGESRRGVVAAASYEARAFGVHSAMPMAEALRKCPQAIVVPCRHGRYAEVSESIFAIFEEYTPLVEGLSVDEAFLDVTHSQSLFGDGQEIAARIKAEVLCRTGLIASAGVAPSKFVAKIASDIGKPNGLVVVRDGDVRAFLDPLPIERMWGVGPKAAARLRARGFRTLSDLAESDGTALEELLGTWGGRVRELARGIDDRPVVPDRAAESIGAEETYDLDLTSRALVERGLLDQSARVARRLTRAGRCARVVVVKLKYSDFKLVSRRLTLGEPVADTDSIFAAAKQLLDRFGDLRPVRLTGVAVADLRDAQATPLLITDPIQSRRDRLEQVVVRVADRFGAGAGLTRAALLDKGRRANTGLSRDPDDPPEARRGT